MNLKDIPQMTNAGNYQVNVDWEYLLHWIDKHLQSGRGSAILDLNPDFQRGHVWNVKQQRKYVEYKMKNGPGADVIYFNCIGWMDDFRGPFVIVDGLQRLTAVTKFMKNKLRVFKGLSDDKVGFIHSDFIGLMRLMRGCEFIINVNNLKNRKEVLTWYLEMNSGGTPHTKKELNKVKELLKK